MPSQDQAAPGDAAWSQTGSGNLNKRKAPADPFADDEEVFCPCEAGPCTLLTSTKPHSQGRKFYRCPKTKEEGQCGFFQWQDQPPRKQQNQGTLHVGEQHNGPSEADGSLQAPQTPECRCGLEAVEITSNSAANPGRVFYKCPKNEAEGRCKFFKWQDELLNSQTLAQQPDSASQAGNQPASNMQAAPSAAAGGSGVFADGDDDFDDNFGLDEALNNAAAGKAPAVPSSYAQQGWEGQQHFAQQQGGGGHQANGIPPTSPGAQPPEILNCDCGLQCSYIMAKTAKNDGRWFYRCPKPKEEGQCRFFQWADELGQQPPSAGRGGEPARAGAGSGPYGGPAPSYHTYSSPPKMGAGGAAASTDACFKCGETGHWSRDCPSGGGGGGGGSAAGGSACFKCGQEGHWARDCPNPGSGGRGGGGAGRRGGGGGRGYGAASSRGYGGAQGYGGGRGGGAAAAPGACYKCGQSGHWTNSCPN